MEVAALYRYPVKSLGGESVHQLVPRERGFRDDRRWMLVDADGTFISQRTHPELAQFSAELREAEGLRIRSVSDGAVVWETQEARPEGGQEMQVTVWDDTFAARLVPTPAELGERLGLPRSTRLVYMSERGNRPVDPRYARQAERVSFADGYPYLIATTASLADLADRLGRPVEMLRFRPNLVVAGAGAYAEDTWDTLHVGAHTFYLPKPCARCIMVTQHPRTGERDPSILAGLAAYRKRGNKVLFGVNALWAGGAGAIACGDSVSPGGQPVPAT
ncbi:MOSC domain-containing protein [Lewinella sp. IMCC34183]|uniref:MOSC domain-containing protein n=1 Tax=Lewinella sp. IMCC34183 TaxID=2248762 RepID=UPI000E26513F|nr:MOSC N-terminal beta barrel domain-containing protein [Lewinella sp. IMCC34183]